MGGFANFCHPFWLKCPNSMFWLALKCTKIIQLVSLLLFTGQVCREEKLSKIYQPLKIGYGMRMKDFFLGQTAFFLSKLNNLGNLTFGNFPWVNSNPTPRVIPNNATKINSSDFMALDWQLIKTSTVICCFKPWNCARWIIGVRRTQY